MKIASRFQTPLDAGATVHLTLDGEPVLARAGDTVAAALLAHSGDATRQSATGAQRTAFCMMGVCFDCLIEVDGRPNCQACMIQVQEGMMLRRQHGLRKLVGDDSNA